MYLMCTLGCQRLIACAAEDDDERFHLMPKMWINCSLHKLANGEFMEPYQTQQGLRKCCRWCHDCHDDALSLLCLCRRYEV